MDVYIDVLVLENTIINFLILYVTSRFAKVRIPSWRILLGAIIGTAYVVILLLMPSVTFYYSIFAKFALSLAIIAVSFWTPRIKEFLKILVCFYISTFVFAGGAFALIYITGSGGFVRNGVYYIFQKANGITMVLIVLFIAILVKVFYEIIQNRASKAKLLIPLSILMDNRTLNIKGLVDTGNSLHDPLSNLPVVVVEFSSLKEMLPVKLASVLNCGADDLGKISGIITDCDWSSRVRLVPFSSLGKENGLLLGFRPDRIFIGENNKEVLAIVCIYNRKLSANNSYSALLSPELV